MDPGQESAAPGSPPQPDIEAAKRLAGRILHDLVSEHPLDALLRQQAEHQATPRRRPRSPRTKSAEPIAPQPAVRPDEELITTPEVVGVPTPSVAEADVEAIDGKASRNGDRARAYRRAKRVGTPEALRPGERWKRRLPPVCW